jgi:hypothetical protein
MDYKEMEQVLGQLNQAMITLEDTYMESEGEITEQTEQMEQEISCLRELLAKDGVDLLGAWLKAKEDKKKALKAEKDYITRQMAAIDKTIEFIKDKVCHVMVSLGREKVKGDRGYSFTATTSVKAEVNKVALDEAYLKLALLAARQNGLPEWIGIQLKTTTSEIKAVGGDALMFLDVTETPSVRFVKPRASKEE